MQYLALAPSPMVVKNIVEKHLRLYALPLHLPLVDVGYNSQQLQELKRKFSQQFDKDIEVHFSDTITTLSEKLN